MARRAGIALLVAGALGLLWIHDLASSLWLALGCLTLSFAGLLVASLGPGRLGAGRILLVAGLLRLLLIPLPPSLSNDVWRYLWDGRVALHGENPYLLAPEDPRLEALRDEIWHRLDHREVPTLYPPAALAAFSICARLPGSLWLWKLLVGAADLLTCWWLLRICQREGLPGSRALWYAWNPLVALETAGMGHVDALAVAVTVAAVWLLRRPEGSDRASAVAAATGALAKLGPVAAWPLWARASGRPLQYLAVAGGITAIACAPVVVSAGGVPPGLATYVVSWEFAGPLYEPLWRLLDALGTDDAVKASLDGIKAWTGDHEIWNRWYRFVYPELLAKILLAGLAAGFWVVSWRAREVGRGTGFLFGGLLLASATVYPWYLLWVLPWAALYRWRAWLFASAAIPFSYLASLGEMVWWPWLHLSIWGPFLVIGIFEASRRQARTPPPTTKNRQPRAMS